MKYEQILPGARKAAVLQLMKDLPHEGSKVERNLNRYCWKVESRFLVYVDFDGNDFVKSKILYESNPTNYPAWVTMVLYRSGVYVLREWP